MSETQVVRARDVRASSIDASLSNEASPRTASKQSRDFFFAPTALARLMLQQKYHEAFHAVDEHKKETATWLTAERSSGKYLIHQLPLHMACQSLGRTADRALTRQLDFLVAKLVVVYPKACEMADHTGQLPIHYALRYGASVGTISTLLIANPDVLNEQERLMQLHRTAPGTRKGQVEELLSLGVSFWRSVHQEATSFPEELVSLSCSSRQTSAVSIVAWQQLEDRVVQLEQLLAVSNERNLQLQQAIDELTSGLGGKQDDDRRNHLEDKLLAVEQVLARVLESRQSPGALAELTEHVEQRLQTKRLLTQIDRLQHVYHEMHEKYQDDSTMSSEASIPLNIVVSCEHRLSKSPSKETASTTSHSSSFEDIELPALCTYKLSEYPPINEVGFQRLGYRVIDDSNSCVPWAKGQRSWI